MTAPTRDPWAPPADAEGPPDGLWDDAPPHDLAAEREVLGIMLWSPDAVEAVGEILDPDDFYRVAHGVIYRAVITMHAAGEEVGCLSVREWIDRQMGEIRALGGHEQAASYLMGLWSGMSMTTAPRAARAAQTVRDRSLRRHGLESLTRGMQLITSTDRDAVELLAATVDELDRAALRVADAADPLGGPVTAAEFTARQRQETAGRRVLIPRVVNTRDRVVIVGPEGGGKSTLGRQFAVCGTAGVHPFEMVPVAPVRALIMDLENPRDYLADGLEPMLGLARGYPGWDEDRLQVWSRRVHMDLRDPGDGFRVASVIRRARPDLVVAGPAWKMIRPGREGWEAATWELTAFWDRMIDRYGFALWLETHPLAGRGKAREWRPRGGEVWQAWPDIGLSLIPAPKGEPDGSLRVDRFRRDRPAGRSWPVMLHRATAPGQWPWSARYPDGTLL